ncbi:hypothetical protein DFQ30_006534 [Apophysomyces sp. BC1015]|nr:hypothetical protein DFQ30_006534 [Apophysomyces sp. BC1015]
MCGSNQYDRDEFVESDYVLVFLASPASYRPPWMWLLQAYRLLDRRYKKNLKALYVVHLSLAYRMIFEFANRIISPKFASKLHYVSDLEELDQIISLSQLNIPQPVVDYELQLSRNKPVRRASQATIRTKPEPEPISLAFGRKLEDLAALDQFRSDTTHKTYIPSIVRQIVEHLQKEGTFYREFFWMDQVGIFRKSPSSTELQMVKTSLDQGLEVDLSKHDVNVSAALLKVFLRDLPEPLISSDFVKDVGDLSGTTSYSVDLIDRVRSKLDESHQPLRIGLLGYVFDFLGKVSQNSELNKMTPHNLAIVFSPNLVRDRDTKPVSGYGPVVTSLSQDALTTAAQCVRQMNQDMGLVRMMILERERIFHADDI